MIFPGLGLISWVGSHLCGYHANSSEMHSAPYHSSSGAVSPSIRTIAWFRSLYFQKDPIQKYKGICTQEG